MEISKAGSPEKDFSSSSRRVEMGAVRRRRESLSVEIADDRTRLKFGHQVSDTSYPLHHP